jgi:hypothetical protein
MHASTRILLFLVAIVAIVVGWWILYAINSTVVAIIYGVLWTAFVLIAIRVLLAIGFGFNRLTSGRGRRAESGSSGSAAATDALAELNQLRERDLISVEEYEAKRAKILERL